MQIKRCYPYFVESFISLSMMLLGIILGCVMLYFNRNTRLGIIVSLIVIAIMAAGAVLMIFVGNAFEYWGIDDITVYRKKLFRKKVIIPLDKIESIEDAVYEECLGFLTQADALLICGDNKKILIAKTAKKKIAILEERLKPYMKESAPQADAPQT